MTVSRSVAVVVVAALAAAPVPAEPVPWTDHPLCPLVETQLRNRAQESELAIEQARVRLEAAREVFALVDRLWRDEAIDRTRYLRARHARDVAEVEIDLRLAIRDRDRAEFEQYRLFCVEGEEPGEAPSEKRYRDARRDHDRHECRRLDHELTIARLDHAFRKELLERVRDLRSGDVATKLDVLVTEADVVDARTRVDHYASRVRACRPEEDSGLETGSAR